MSEVKREVGTKEDWRGNVATVTTERPAEERRETTVCPSCKTETAQRIGSSQNAWRCMNCGKQFERAGADAPYTLLGPGVRND